MAEPSSTKVGLSISRLTVKAHTAITIDNACTSPKGRSDRSTWSIGWLPARI